MKNWSARPSFCVLAYLLFCIGNITVWDSLWMAALNIWSDASLEMQIEQMAWDNESFAWALWFSPCTVLAIVMGIVLFKTRKRVAVPLIVLGAISFVSVWIRFPQGLEPQSKADTGKLQMLQYWTDAGGWVAVFVIMPLLIWLLVLLFLEECRREGE